VLGAALPATAVTIENEHVAATLTRSARGLEVRLRGDTGPTPLCAVIAGLHLKALSHLQVVQRDSRSFDEQELDALKNNLRRLAPGTLELPESWGLIS
jgi:hypothetical protein